MFLTVREINRIAKNRFEARINDFEKDILFPLLSKQKEQFYKKEVFTIGVNDINPSLASGALTNLQTYGLIESTQSTRNINFPEAAT